MKIKLVIATIVAVLATIVTGTTQAKQESLPHQPHWLPRIYYAIAVCETGLNYKHHTRDYQGAYGFYRGSWDEYKPSGYPNDADQATPYQQYVVAKRIHDKYNSFSGWGCYRNGDYRYYM